MNRVKIFFGILAFVGLSLGITAQVTVVDSGSCGANLTWVLTSDSTLTISGSWAMSNYTAISPPWLSHQSMIVGNGVSVIIDTKRVILTK